MYSLARFKTFLPFFLLFFLPAFSQAQPVRGVAGDLWADLVLGQPGYGSLTYGLINASGIFIAGGVAADPNPAHHRIYVWDAGNSRILGFSNTTLFQPNSTATSLGYTADIVLGQPDFNHAGCNGDSNDQLWPNYVPPSQTSLCGMWQRQGSISEGGSQSAMAVDPATGDLYVADVFNNRVLRFAYGSLISGAEGVSAAGVWGQPDYSSFLVNQGFSGPTNSTLFFSGTSTPSLVGPCANGAGYYATGVGFDSNHNLWVADSANNRVLRFPSGTGGIPQSTADLVLGQASFYVNGTTNMTVPTAVRVDGYGNVYVVDYGAPAGRILVFNQTTYSGLSADTIPDLVYTNSAVVKSLGGIDMDNSGNLWAANGGDGGYPGSNLITELEPLYSGTSVTGFQVINALGQDTLPPTPPSGSYGESGPDFSFIAGGSVFSAFLEVALVAVDGSGNVYAFGKGGTAGLFRFPAPIPTPQVGKSYSADVDIFKQTAAGGGDQVGMNGLVQPFGVAVADDNTSSRQLIVADSFRLDYWNMGSTGPTALTTYQPPDGYAGVSSSNVTIPGLTGNSFTRIRVDHSSGATGSQHLWVIAQEQTAQIYKLPLADYASASSAVNTNIPVLGAPVSLVDWTGQGGLSGLNDLMPQGSVSAPYASGPVSYLWVADNIHGRIFRVRDPLGRLGLGPVVDILIGQTTAANNTCSNFGTVGTSGCAGNIPENQYTLNWPGSVGLDHAGNLYVNDFSLETAGNWRLLEYDESEIAQATQNSISTGQIQFLSNSVSYTGATHVYGQNGSFTSSCATAPPPSNPIASACMPLQAAFPSNDQAMVVEGFEGVPQVIPSPHTNFDPNNSTLPWTHLNDFYSNMYSDTFDGQNNLYTVDNNRARLLVYYNPVPDPTPTPTGTLTPVPTPTSTITPTPGCFQVIGPLPSPTAGFVGPAGIAVDYAHNLLYVANSGKQTVEVYGYSAGSLPNYLGPLQGVALSVSHLALDQSGNLYLVSGAQVYKTALGGSGLTASSLTPILTLSYAINGLYVDRTGGILYLTEAQSTGTVVDRFDGSGTSYSLTQTLTNSVFAASTLTGILVEPTGPNQNTIYVADYFSYVIRGLSETWSAGVTTYGTAPFTTSISTILSYPLDIQTDLAGNIYVANVISSVDVFSPTSDPTVWFYQHNIPVPYGPYGIGIDQFGEIFASTHPSNPNDAVLKIRGCETEPSLTPTGTPFTPTPTGTPTNTPSATPSNTTISTATNSPTSTPTLTPTFTSSATPSYSPTITPTFTPSSTPTASPTVTPTSTITSTATEGCHAPVCYPNPVKGGNQFSLHLSPCDQVPGIRIKLYTLAFRKVLDTQFNSSSGAVWDVDLTDNWGSPLANGLYYLVIERPEGRVIEKLLILR